jgi:hypothetical protein
MDDGEAYVPAAADAARLIALPVTTTGDVPVYKNSFCTFRVIVKVEFDKYLKIAIAGLVGSAVPPRLVTLPVNLVMISVDDWTMISDLTMLKACVNPPPVTRKNSTATVELKVYVLISKISVEVAIPAKMPVRATAETRGVSHSMIPVAVSKLLVLPYAKPEKLISSSHGSSSAFVSLP